MQNQLPVTTSQESIPPAESMNWSSLSTISGTDYSNTKETSTTHLCTHAITNPSSGGETRETRRNQTRSIQEHPQGTKCTAHEKEGEQMFQAIPRRWPSMDRGHKSENPVPYSDTRTKVLQTFQNPETNVTSSIPGGDTKTLEDP